MEAILPIIVQLIAGAAGGYGIAAATKNLTLGTTWNLVIGAVGGVALVWIAAMIPGIAGLVAMTGAGIDFAALVAQIVVGLIGGGLLTAIAAAGKKAMAK